MSLLNLVTYNVKGLEFGQTLDFVFTATGVDGYMQSVDYPLWVTANEGEFVITLPETLPSRIYSNESVAFEVELSSTNVLKSFVVTKNGAQFDSKEDFDTTDKFYTYMFEYLPVIEDVDEDIEFHFVATDVKGNVAEAYYTVSVVKADNVGKALYEEKFDTSLTVSGTADFETQGTSGVAAEFVADKINQYNELKDGCKVYEDYDLSSLTYTGDGTDACLSKNKVSGSTEVTGTYLYLRKAKAGWLRVDGIRLYGAVSLKLSYSQATANSKIKVEYSIDEGMTWENIIETSTVAVIHEQKFTLPQAAETISLKITENGGSAHARIDNIKLVEIL